MCFKAMFYSRRILSSFTLSSPGSSIVERSSISDSTLTTLAFVHSKVESSLGLVFLNHELDLHPAYKETNRSVARKKLVPSCLAQRGKSSQKNFDKCLVEAPSKRPRSVLTKTRVFRSHIHGRTKVIEDVYSRLEMRKRQVRINPLLRDETL